MVDRSASERGPEQTCEGGAIKRHRLLEFSLMLPTIPGFMGGLPKAV